VFGYGRLHSFCALKKADREVFGGTRARFEQYRRKRNNPDETLLSWPRIMSTHARCTDACKRDYASWSGGFVCTPVKISWSAGAEIGPVRRLMEPARAWGNVQCTRGARVLAKAGAKERITA
jgi:hypothetical protein